METSDSWVVLAKPGGEWYLPAMHVPLVMTVIGKDRPGLVETVARLVAEHGGNWLESRMCRLGGEFAGILRIHLAKDEQAALEMALRDLARQGLTVFVQEDRGGDAATMQRLARLEIIGQDHPGIVRQIAAALAQQGVNVEEFSSECTSAPMSGEMLFHANITMHIPATCELADLRRELEKLANDLVVDVAFEELPVPS
ncbi:MAG: ACT domain-containing protein [Verrucomicrobia bacterium]|nr:ACT domain-containing protein [Verrucomicrobiota bacterium]